MVLDRELRKLSYPPDQECCGNCVYFKELLNDIVTQPTIGHCPKVRKVVFCNEGCGRAELKQKQF